MKKSGPRKGSRPYMLVNMKPGQRAILEAPPGRVSVFMQQIGSDVTRNGLVGKIKLSHILGVEVSSREVIDMVLVVRLEDEEPT